MEVFKKNNPKNIEKEIKKEVQKEKQKEKSPKKVYNSENYLSEEMKVRKRSISRSRPRSKKIKRPPTKKDHSLCVYCC